MTREEFDFDREPTVLDITPEEADALRAQYEAEEAAKATRRREEQAEWFRQLARARNNIARGLTTWQQEELAADMAWARSVLIDGETFRTGDQLFLALYTARKASLARGLTFSETARLRRLLVALAPTLVEQEVVA